MSAKLIFPIKDEGCSVWYVLAAASSISLKQVLHPGLPRL
jgi:hypothetical protein